MGATAHKKELHEFVVTTFTAAPPSAKSKPDGADSVPYVLASEVWHSDSPLGVGHPFGWILERTDGGVRIRKVGAETDQVITDPFQEFALPDLFREEPIELIPAGGAKGGRHRYWVTIRPVMEMKQIAEEAAAITWRPQAIPTELMADLDNRKQFRFASILVLALCLAGWLGLNKVEVKKENPEELIPPQFAKVILSPALKERSNQAGRAASGRKGAEYNVVQAFQNAQVQKTTKSLLNVKAAQSLLSKSSLLDSVQSKTAVRKVFDTKSSLKPIGKLDVNAIANNAARPNGLTSGKGGKFGAGAGTYGNATGVAVNGMGESLMALSTEGLGVDEGLTKDEVGKVIRQHLSEVRYCYEAAMVRNPGFEGKLVVSFMIRGNGTVKSTQTKESSGDRALDSCILTRLVKWQFPKPRGGVDVGVSYPFIFKSLGN